jgi:hypothetical protein
VRCDLVDDLRLDRKHDEIGINDRSASIRHDRHAV